MAAPSTPVYILPGSTLKQETIDHLLTTFSTTSALQTIGVPPSPLPFHTVSADAHRCSNTAQIANYHLQNKEALVSIEPVIVLDDQSEGENGTVLVVGFPVEKDDVSLSDDEEQPAQPSATQDTEVYPSVRVVPEWVNPLVANLSIGHQDLNTYIESAQEDGVFRGFPSID